MSNLISVRYIYLPEYRLDDFPASIFNLIVGIICGYKYHYLKKTFTIFLLFFVISDCPFLFMSIIRKVDLHKKKLGFLKKLITKQSYMKTSLLVEFYGELEI